ncbi:OmpH family outer membrane protein [Palleronia marisminoris]|uniref:OmpH family outer membrane protein n=1 Tax=Palleronia marisminoris TaxID=315423 RepID=UPI001587A53A|nr:OmpH family outer membrane protein [Palleronia marisminoris]
MSAQPIGGVAVVDQERMFRQSAFGAQLLSEIDAQGDELAAENREIEATLTAEERSLTEARAELDPAEFRDRARVFDEKVRRLRAEQDAKARALADLQEDARATFVRRVSPVLSALLAEIGADVLLDRRMVLTAGTGVDITDRAIARIDETLAAEEADGAGAETPPAATDASD